jgi:predicted Zn-dependent protease
MKPWHYLWALALPLSCLADDGSHPEAEAAIRAGSPGAAFDNERYRLGYEVYLAHGDRSAAYQVARKALQSRPNDAEWLRRLARAAEWIGQPAVALDAWLRLARVTDEQPAWAAVGRLAPGLLNDGALLAYQKKVLEKQGVSEKIVKDIAQTYERLGQADEGLAFLDSLAGTDASAYLLDAEAALAEHTGHDDRAKKLLAQLIQRYGPAEGWLLRLVALQYAHGELDAAWNVLQTAAARMPKTATGYWQTYAELSSQLNRRREASMAYQVLVDSGKAGVADLMNYVTLLEARDGLAAARLSETAFRKFDDDNSLITALYLYDREHQLQAAQALLDSLKLEQRQRLERLPDFLGHRAQLEWQLHQYELARTDFAAALRLAPRNMDYLQALVLVVIDQKDMAELRRLLETNHHLAEVQPQLWSEWGTGWELLEQPRQAMPFLLAYCRANPADNLGLLHLADGYEKSGDPAHADILRRQVLRKTAGTGIGAPSSGRLEALQEALLSLRLEQAAPDPALLQLRARLKPGADGRIDPLARDLALSWLLAHGSEEKAQHWMTTAYGTDQPLWAKVKVAQAAQDEGAMQRLLNDTSHPLDKSDSIEMTTQLAEQMDWPMLAQTEAFEALEQNPNDLEQVQRFRSLASAQAHALAVNADVLQQGDLERAVGGLEWVTPLSARWLLQLDANHIAQRSDNLALLGRAPSGDREALTLQRQTAGSTLRMAVANTSLLRDYVSASLGADHHPQRTLGLSWRLDYNADAPESSALLAAGVKDQLTLGADWMMTPRWFLNSEIEAAQFYGQDRHRLGNGGEFTLVLGRHFTLATLDQTVKLQGTATHFTPDNAPLPVGLQALVPAGDAASARFFMPVGYRQISAYWDFGEPSPAAYQPAWHAFGEFGPVYANTSGSGYEARIGAGGPLLGHDRLSMSVEQEKSGQSNGGVIKRATATYRYLY